MNILIIGCGYVGLVTGTCFATMGHNVTCFDLDKEKIQLLQNGIVPIYEPGLKELILQSVEEKRLSFLSSHPSLEAIDVAFLCVPTPQLKDGSCNTQFLFSAAKALAQRVEKPLLVVNKCTAPIGTTQTLKKILQEELKEGQSFSVASNPEFLKEGSAVFDFMKPDRIVIGVEDTFSENLLRSVYAPFMFNRNRLIVMDIASAELTKYASNAMLSSRISFMNEIASIAEKVGANIHEVRKGVGSDKRIGYDFLYAGFGYGGSCFPKDNNALIHMAKNLSIEVPVLEAVEKTNKRQKQLATKILDTYFSNRGGLKNKTIAIWGLSFKPDTDDIREAPSLTIIEELQKKGAFLQLFDPAAMQNVQNHLPNQKNILFCKNALQAAKGADAICLVTEWKQFRMIDFTKIDSKKDVLVLDGRNQYDKKELLEKGFSYIGIGTTTN